MTIRLYFDEDSMRHALVLALRARGVDKLYGYTSDEDGVRHGIFDAPEIGFNEAKFMLVACSALINFLISKSSTTT